MHVGIITEYAMNRTHGTGVQLLRLFQGQGVAFSHFYMWDDGSGHSECQPSYAIADPFWKYYRGRRTVTRIQHVLPNSWWPLHNLNLRKFRALVGEEASQIDVAYVVVAHEDYARRAFSLLAHLKCPYVVHIMDIYHEDGLKPASMPGFANLLSHASAVIALTETIRTELLKFDVESVSVLPIGQDSTPHEAAPWQTGQPVRLLIVGKPYPVGTQLITQARSALAQRFPDLQIEYAGTGFHHLPPELQKVTTDHGFITDHNVYNRLVADCHLAYLPGPSELDAFGKFSFPSRTSDYFMAGLPVMACVPAGSAAEGVLAPLEPECVHITRTPEELTKAVADFTSSPERWKQASRRARDFAATHLSIDVIRPKIFGLLEASCASTSATHR